MPDEEMLLQQDLASQQPVGGGYGELNPIAPESQAEGVAVQNPQETQEVMSEYGIS